MNTMFKVLIVDDSPSKIEAIKKVLHDRCGIELDNIEVAKSVNSGITSLKHTFFHLVILDLVLPQYDNELPVYDGGLSFLKTLRNENDFNLPLQIICLTERPDVIHDNKEEYDNLMISIIEKKDKQSSWINQITEKVNYSNRLRNHVEDALFRRTKFQVGIICAVEDEFKELIDVFGKDQWSDYDLKDCNYAFKNTTLSTKNRKDIEVIAACANGAGGTATSVLTSFMLSHFDLEYIFMTGITGAIKSKDIHLGDIVISQSALNYAVGKITETEGAIELAKEIKSMTPNPGLINKMSSFISDSLISKLLKRINQCKKIPDFNVPADPNYPIDPDEAKDFETLKKNFKIIKEPTTSGPFVVASEKFTKELMTIDQRDRKMKAIDMEGYDFYYTANIYNTPALWIKGIVDWADPTKRDKYHQFAAYGSALLLNYFIKERLYK